MLERVSSLRRIVKQPERWDRIVQLAATYSEKLPPDPDSKALNDFLLKRKAADPDHFADLSLAGYVYYPEETGLSWSSYPNIEAWKKRIAALPGWAGPYELMAPKLRA